MRKGIVLKNDSIEINDDSEIADDLGFTSLSFFELIFEIEAVYGIRFADRKLRNIEKVSDIREAIQNCKK